MPMTKATKPKQKAPTRRKPAGPKVERITMHIRDAAAYIGVSAQVAYAEAKAGRLPIVRIRGRVLVVKPLLDEMLLEKARLGWER